MRANLSVTSAMCRSFAAITIVLISFVALLPGVSDAQISEEEHLSHHPEEAANAEKDKKSSDEAGAGGMMGGGMSGMMGKGGMGGMMEKMGAPKERELYPELMTLPGLPMEKREDVRRKARQRMYDGVSLMAEGMGDLSDATPRDDVSAMQDAIEKVSIGLAHYDSGLAAYRALVEGSEPRNVALQWFRKEMNLVGSGAPAEHQHGILGMSVFHFVSMTALIVFAALMLAMYFFKMRRATQLIEEVAARTSLPASPTGPGPSDVSSTQVSKAPQAEGASSVEAPPPKPPVVDPPEFPEMRSRTVPVKSWSGKLRVESILEETPTVKTFRLSMPDSVVLPFAYYPGQFLTFSLNIGGKPVKRSYTIASSPTQSHYCAVTVKREEDGMVSRYLHDEVKEGDLLELSAPFGKFVFTGEESDSIVLIAGGVGITPMMSAVRYLTDIGWRSDIYFLFACRTTDDFIFRRELEQLQLIHPNLHVHASMTREPGAVWMGLKGYFTTEIINHLVPGIADRRVHVCGPPPMMDAMLANLAALGVAEDFIFTEAFGPAKKPVEEKGRTEARGADITSTKVTFARSETEADLAPDQTVLEAADEVGVEIDNSCRSGQCGLCKVKLLSGEVSMEVEDSLSDDDKTAGLILACQAKATQPVSIDA